MDLRNRIWYDLRESKHAICYLSLYLAKSKDNAKHFQLAIILISFLGSGLSFFDESAAVIGCIIILILQVLNELKFIFIIDQQSLEKISRMKRLHVKFFDEVSPLWSKYSKGELSDERASEIFSDIRKKLEKIEKIDDTVRIKKFKSLHTKSDSETDKYLKEIYY